MARLPNSGPGADPGGEPGPRVEVRRSSRRRRTVAAYREGDTVVVMMPARFTRAEEREWVETMLARLDKRDRRRQPSDATLARRASELSRRHLDGQVHPSSVRWADNQLARWGSCSVEEGSIRLSRRLEGMPPWVLDYVLMHELCHLLIPGHTPRFWELVERYPRTERARGYLEGVSETAGLSWTED
jgi:predicted metal-dependent hydrolase